MYHVNILLRASSKLTLCIYLHADLLNFSVPLWDLNCLEEGTHACFSHYCHQHLHHTGPVVDAHCPFVNDYLEFPGAQRRAFSCFLSGELQILVSLMLSYSHSYCVMKDLVPRKGILGFDEHSLMAFLGGHRTFSCGLVECRLGIQKVLVMGGMEGQCATPRCLGILVFYRTSCR